MTPRQAIKRWLHDFVTRHTARCPEINRMASEALEHKLPLRKRVEMRLHFLVCVWCVRYAKQISFLRQAAPEFADRTKGVKMPEDTKQRIKKALQSRGAG